MKKRMVMSIGLLLMGLGITTTVIAAAPEQPMVVMQEEVTFKEIQKEELPETVTAAIQDAYADYTLSKAYVGSDSSYKVELTQGDENIAVFFNANGEFLKVERADKGGTEEPQ
ncbi:hypothetical protein [Mariniphaga sediminis]|nr:hypothetical protein [Mariniphaga sediminis]